MDYLFVLVSVHPSSKVQSLADAALAVINHGTLGP